MICRRIVRHCKRAVISAALLTAAAAMTAMPGAAEPSHAIAMHGEPKFGPDVPHFPYVNPDAPKGGALTLGVVGSFDSLNPFIVQGVAAKGLREYVFESLMTRGLDEPFTLYGLLAESVDVPDDRSSVTFRINPRATYSDGTPVLPEHVLFSWELLRTKGRPNYRTYYNQVEKAELLDDRSVRFTFKQPADREMPLIMGLMPIVSPHHYDADDFQHDGSRRPLGSGPYVADRVEIGKSITYRRNPDYWGRDLPVNRGRYNFDTIKFEYYRNDNALFEAFKKGLVDVRVEEDPTRWATEYNFPAANAGEVILEEVDSGVPRGMSALVFNTRRPVFSDIRVREALVILFDGAWINKTLYRDLYERTQSYFGESVLSSHGRPASAQERELLAPWADLVRPDVMDGTYAVPQSDGSGRDRASLRRAIELLDAAGYGLVNGVMTDKASGKPLTFEILVGTPDQERLALSYVRFLQRAGIRASVRQVDSAQFERRRQTYDFDMMPYFWFSSLSPGNEQKFYWGSEAARTDGTRNYMGADNPGIDAMIEALLAADENADFINAVRALDRLLMSGIYVVPLYHLPGQWVARWARIGRPETTSLYGFEIDTLWSKGAEQPAGAAEQAEPAAR
ncbi:extracellular solute-binding protein [Microbaculum marinum]|uniref:Extracellular solute-binding protein n=1 Tax=Microbaculum marinum TaxID=1764581 RepID=A0AAW9RWI3_9HYPH